MQPPRSLWLWTWHVKVAERDVLFLSLEKNPRTQSIRTDAVCYMIRAKGYYNWRGRSDDDERHINGHTAVSRYIVAKQHKGMSTCP